MKTLLIPISLTACCLTLLSCSNDNVSDSQLVSELWVAIIGEAILIIGLGIALFKRSSATRIKRIIADSKRIGRKYVAKKEFQEFRDAVEVCQKQHKESMSAIETLNHYYRTEKAMRGNNPQTVFSGNSTMQDQQPNVKYPKTIIENGFRDDLSDLQEDNYFRFFDFNNNDANFEFCGNDFEKAIVRKNTLEIVCEITKISVNADKIENEAPGSVTLKDGKWEVTKKAKIIFV